jgi:hypothetical protein
VKPSILNKLLCRCIWTITNGRPSVWQTSWQPISKNGFGNLSQQKDGGINDKRKVANLLHRVTFSKW